jgi:hypothetical protein
MEVISLTLNKNGYVLRSGGAGGADMAFERGCNKGDSTKKEIYLPWKGFNGNPSALFSVCDKAKEIAADVIGVRWKWMNPAVKLLMARNVYQVLGKNLDSPSSFLVCFTPDGCFDKATRTPKTGGTGQAIAIASERNIPVYNLQRGVDMHAIKVMMLEMEKQDVENVQDSQET